MASVPPVPRDVLRRYCRSAVEAAGELSRRRPRDRGFRGGLTPPGAIVCHHEPRSPHRIRLPREEERRPRARPLAAVGEPAVRARVRQGRAAGAGLQGPAEAATTRRPPRSSGRRARRQPSDCWRHGSRSLARGPAWNEAGRVVPKKDGTQMAPRPSRASGGTGSPARRSTRTCRSTACGTRSAPGSTRPTASSRPRVARSLGPCDHAAPLRAPDDGGAGEGGGRSRRGDAGGSGAGRGEGARGLSAARGQRRLAGQPAPLVAPVARRRSIPRGRGRARMVV